MLKTSGSLKVFQKAIWPVIEKHQCFFSNFFYNNYIKISNKLYRLLVNGLLCVILKNKDIVCYGTSATGIFTAVWVRGCLVCHVDNRSRQLTLCPLCGFCHISSRKV